MLWIILLVISLIGIGLSIYLDWFGEGGWQSFVTLVSTIGSIISGVAILFCFLAGIDSYPHLIGDLRYINTQQENIESIRQAYYSITQENNGNLLIAGSLDNVQQSTNLSQFIRDIANNKAEYNQELTKIRIYRNIGISYWMGNKIFQNSGIDTLSLIL